MDLLEMRGICKSFVGVPVLKDVDLTVRQGEVHALLGENGAGKSTLMNVLTGVHSLDSGRVFFGGREITGLSIRQTEEAGIAFVHQELNLFNDLRVYENIFFNKEETDRFGTLKRKSMIEKCRGLFTRLGVDIDPGALVETLKASEKQTLEIAKAIFFEAKLLILDEPTTALSNEEIDRLFSIIRSLKAEGRAFIFISHKMPEIFRIADRYTVLRNGEFVGTGTIADAAPDQVTSMLVGSTYKNAEIYEQRPLGEPVLEVRDFTGRGFKNVSFSVRRGEIVGLTGLQGSGSSELMQAIFGDSEVLRGELTVLGQRLRRGGIHAAMKSRLALLPSNRKENSVLPDMTILENTYVSEHALSARHPHISRRRELGRYNGLRDMLNIKAGSCDEGVLSLSGGNQQKVFLARWLNTQAEVLLLDNPTQGIDVGAKAEIYKLILELSRQGKTILFNTLEIPEIQKIADRCFIFYNGEIKKILSHDEISEHTVMLYATNAVQAREEK